MLASLTAFWAAHGQLLETIAVLLLPSIITAASNRPQTAGFVPVLQVVLKRLSVLTHADEPGTLKLPLSGGPSAMLVLLLAGSLLACKASPEVIALTSLRATAATIADAAKVYHDAAPKIIEEAQDKAAAFCTPDGGDLDHACLAAHTAPTYAAMRKADAALKVYAHAARGGVDAASADYLKAANEAIDALAPLGIVVKGGK